MVNTFLTIVYDLGSTTIKRQLGDGAVDDQRPKLIFYLRQDT